MGIKFIAAALALLGATAPAASAEPKAPLKLWRLDCGSLVEPPPTPWRKAEMRDRGEKAWRPLGRKRDVSPALRAYAALTTNAARGAVRDVSQVDELRLT